jgi:hypothetical protein
MLHMCVDIFQSFAVTNGNLLRTFAILLHTHFLLHMLSIVLLHKCFWNVVMLFYKGLIQSGIKMLQRLCIMKIFVCWWGMMQKPG